MAMHISLNIDISIDGVKVIGNNGKTLVTLNEVQCNENDAAPTTNEKAITTTKPDTNIEKKATVNPRVFFDITIGGAPAGRIVMELFADVTPLTAENFLALCTGGKGLGRPLRDANGRLVKGKPLHYKGCRFHSVRKEYCTGGDIIKGDGTDADSIYRSEFFKIENFKKKHTAGALAMVECNVGDFKCVFGSQFFMCMDPMPLQDNKSVVFGQVVEGMNVLKAMTEVGSSSGAFSKPVVIADCGQL